MRNFNLVTDAWIKAKDKDSQIKEYSLLDLFQKASDLKDLAGEAKFQDFAILRLLLAILLTVYQRVDLNGRQYNLADPSTFKESLFTTWNDLHQSHDFSQVIIYLKAHQSEFNLLDHEHPFMQITRGEFQNNVMDNSLKPFSFEGDAGQLPVSQLRRTVSEGTSNLNPLSSIPNLQKQEISLSELTRWLIAYQAYPGTSTKIKLSKANKYSIYRGHVYSLRSFYIQGQSLADTLIMNLNLDSALQQDRIVLPLPSWEQSNEAILEKLRSQRQPDNLPELYSLWSALIYIDPKSLTMYAAGVPQPEYTNHFLEPMTTYYFDKKQTLLYDSYKERDIHRFVWQDFGGFFKTNSNLQPGLLKWLNELKERELLPLDYNLRLQQAGCVSIGGASNKIGYQINNRLQINSALVLGAKALSWRVKLEALITWTNNAAKAIYLFGKNVGSASLATTLEDAFYAQLNVAFAKYLTGLSNQKEMNEQLKAWSNICYHLAKKIITEQVDYAQTNDFVFDSAGYNIFDYQRMALFKIRKELHLHEN